MITFQEIERKFLLKRFPRLAKINTVYQIEQWYHSDGFRYRYQVEIPTGDIHIFKTKKTNISKGVNTEEETTLTPEEFQQLDLANSLHIKKTRTVVKHKGHKLEIDKYEGMNIVIMEIELNDINEKYSLPKYIEKEILYEVTGIKEFSNKSLAE
jgi:CYTH domain-containing protein